MAGSLNKIAAVQDGIGTFDQLAYVVDDIDAAAMRWVARGAGPFFRYTPSVAYRGVAPRIAAQVATGWFQSVMIKLMVPVVDGFLPMSPGLHSLVTSVDDVEAACAGFAAQGQPTVLRAETTDGLHFAFVDARSESGHFWELVQATPTLQANYESLRAAAQGWDGSDPLRGV